MKIRVQKSKDKYLLLFINEDEVKGIYLSKAEMKKLKADIDNMVEYNQDAAGDSL